MGGQQLRTVLVLCLPVAAGCGGDSPTTPLPPPGSTPVGQINFPLALGKKWLYDDTSSGTVCIAGCSTSIFSGRSVLVIDSQLTLQSEVASRVRQFRIAHNGAFSVSTMYLAQRSSGLAKFSVTASAWRTVLSTTSTSFSNGAFLLAGGPLHDAPHVLATETVTVPAGSYAVVAVSHEFTQTGPSAPADIFEDEIERFANNVGLVTAFQDYTFDDNNPSGLDQFAFRLYRLRAFDTFASPALVTESEPNDSGTTALTAVVDSSVISASTRMTDAGAVLAGTAINPDSLGVRRVQDWYRFVAPFTGTVTIRLVAERTDVDLDLYVLRTGASAYTLSGSSVNATGLDEEIALAVTSGLTYYIAVQAWNTAIGGRSNYWIYVR